MADKENYLDYVPKRNSLYQYRISEKGHVEIRVHNTGLFHRIAQIFFKRPKYSNIELDDLGSFIWESMDGKLTIYELGKQVKEQFGSAAEPLYERLTQFVRMLHNNGFIVYVNRQRGRRA